MPPAVGAAGPSELSLLAQQLDELSGSRTSISGNRLKRGRRAAAATGQGAEDAGAAGGAALDYYTSASRAGSSCRSKTASQLVLSGSPLSGGVSSITSGGSEPRWTAAAALRLFSGSRSRDSTPATSAERERSAAASCVSAEDLRLVRHAAASAAERCLPASTSQLSPCLAPYYSPVLHPFWLTQEPDPAENEEEEKEEDEEFLGSLSQLPSPGEAADSTAADADGEGEGMSVTARLRSRSSSSRCRGTSSRKAAARNRRRNKSPRELLQQELPQQSPEAAAAAAAALLSCNSFNSYRIAAVVPPAPGKGTWSDSTTLGELLPLLLPEQYENQREEQQRLQRLLQPLQQQQQQQRQYQLYLAPHDLSQQPLRHPQEAGDRSGPAFSAAAAGGKAAGASAEAAWGVAATAAASEGEEEKGNVLQLPLPTEQLLALLQGRLTTAGGRSLGMSSSTSSSILAAGETPQDTREDEGAVAAAAADVWESWREKSKRDTVSRAFVSASFAAAAATAETEAQRVAAQFPVDLLQRRQLKVHFEKQELLGEDAQTPTAAAANPQVCVEAAAGAEATVPAAGFTRVDNVSAAAGAAEGGAESDDSEDFPFTSRTPVAATLAAEAVAEEAAAAAEREAASLSAACDAVGRVKLQQVWGAAAAEQQQMRLLRELQQHEEQQRVLEAEVRAIHGLKQKLDMWQADIAQPQQQMGQQMPDLLRFSLGESLEKQQQLSRQSSKQQLQEKCAVLVLQQEQDPIMQQQPSLQQQLLLQQQEIPQQKSDVTDSGPGEVCAAERWREVSMPAPQQPTTLMVEGVQQPLQQRYHQQSVFPQQDIISSLTAVSLPVPSGTAGPAAIPAESLASLAGASAAAGTAPTATAVAVTGALCAAPAEADASSAAVAAARRHPPAAAASLPPAAADSASAAAGAAAASVAAVCGKQAHQEARSRASPSQSSPTATGDLVAAVATAAATRLMADTASTDAVAGGLHHIQGSRTSNRPSTLSVSMSRLPRSSSPVTVPGSTHQQKVQQKPQQQQEQHDKFHLVHPQAVQHRTKAEPATLTELSVVSETAHAGEVCGAAADAATSRRPAAVALGPAGGHSPNTADAAPPAPPASPFPVAAAAAPPVSSGVAVPSSAAAAAASARAAHAALKVPPPGAATTSRPAPTTAAAAAAACSRASAAFAATEVAAATTPLAGRPFVPFPRVALDSVPVARHEQQQQQLVGVDQQVQQVKKQQQQQYQQLKQAEPLQRKQQQQTVQQEQLERKQQLTTHQALQSPTLQLRQQQAYLRREGQQYVLREEQQPERQRGQQSFTIHAPDRRNADTRNNLPQAAFKTTTTPPSGIRTSEAAACGTLSVGAAAAAADVPAGRYPVNGPVVVRQWRIVNGVATPVFAAPKTAPFTPAAAAGAPAAALRTPASAAAVRPVTRAALSRVARPAVRSAAAGAAAEPASSKKVSLFEKLRLLLGGGSSSTSCTKCVCSSEAPSTRGSGTSEEDGQQLQRHTISTRAVGGVFPPVWLQQQHQQRPVYTQWQLQQQHQEHLQQQQLRQQAKQQQQQHSNQGAQRLLMPKRPTGGAGQRPTASLTHVVAGANGASPTPLPSTLLSAAYSTQPEKVELCVTQCAPQKQQEQQQEMRPTATGQLEQQIWQQQQQQQGGNWVFVPDPSSSRSHAVAVSAADTPTRRAAEAASVGGASPVCTPGDAAAAAALHFLPSKLTTTEEASKACFVADDLHLPFRSAWCQGSAAAYRECRSSIPATPTAAAAAYESPRRAAADAVLSSSSQPGAPLPIDPQQQHHRHCEWLSVDESKKPRMSSLPFSRSKDERWQWSFGDLPQEQNALLLPDRETHQQLAFQQQLQQLRREHGIYSKQAIADLLSQQPQQQQEEVPYMLNRAMSTPPRRRAGLAAEATHDRYYDSGAFSLDGCAGTGSAVRHPLFSLKNAVGSKCRTAAGGPPDRSPRDGGLARRKAAFYIDDEYEEKWEGAGEEKKRKSKVPDNWIRFGAEAASEEDTGVTAPREAAAGSTAASDEVWMWRKTKPRQRLHPDDITRKWVQQYPTYPFAATVDIGLEQQQEPEQQLGLQQQQVTAEGVCPTGTSHGDVVEQLLQQRRLLQQQRQRLLKQQRQRSAREREEEEHLRVLSYEGSEEQLMGSTGKPLQQQEEQREWTQQSRCWEDNGRQQQVRRQQQQQLRQVHHQQKQHQQKQRQQRQRLRQQDDEKQQQRGQKRGHLQQGIDDRGPERAPDGVEDKAVLISAASAALQTQRDAARDEEEGEAATLQKEHQQAGANNEAGRSPCPSSRKSGSKHSKQGSGDLSTLEQPPMEQPPRDALDTSSSSSGPHSAAVVSGEADAAAAAKPPGDGAEVARAASDAEENVLGGEAGSAGTAPSEATAVDRSGESQHSQLHAHGAQDSAVAAAAAAHIAAVAATKAARAADTAVAVLTAAKMDTLLDVHRTLQQQEKQGPPLNQRSESGVPVTASRQLRDKFTTGSENASDGGGATMLAVATKRENYGAAIFARGASEAAVDADTADITSLGRQQSGVAASRVQWYSSVSVRPAVAAAARKDSGTSAAAGEEKDGNTCRGSVGNPSAAAAATAAAAAAAAEVAQEAARRAAANIEEAVAAVTDPLQPLKQLFSFCTGGGSDAGPSREVGGNAGIWAAASGVSAPTYYRTCEATSPRSSATVSVENLQQQPLVLRYWYKTPRQGQELQQQEIQQMVGGQQQQQQVRSYYTSPVNRPEEPPPVLCHTLPAAAVEVSATSGKEFQHVKGVTASRRPASVTRKARRATSRPTIAATYDYPLCVQ